jgi:hypothetical protein
MALVEILQQVGIWIVVAISAYFVYRLIFGSGKDAKAADYDNQINEILTSDKYKVKGRFD